ncbi:hypothetical protein J8273_8729 [Carpediemonas membranifera]|uniref:Uncharacterized protein n=1 Tax=Carpediemonas membranifera TaxID=201153 RepID=A0A8J6E0J8_9EUKA|nr:hypothetical protein J8273_8729 [Carpediemonas membranifera]|eukprot:KAG9389437.1 hypothetical protein J8273_8729 [Carpediemonas membranifera]
MLEETVKRIEQTITDRNNVPREDLVPQNLPIVLNENTELVIDEGKLETELTSLPSSLQANYRAQIKQSVIQRSADFLSHVRALEKRRLLLPRQRRLHILPKLCLLDLAPLLVEVPSGHKVHFLCAVRSRGGTFEVDDELFEAIGLLNEWKEEEKILARSLIEEYVATVAI